MMVNHPMRDGPAAMPAAEAVALFLHNWLAEYGAVTFYRSCASCVHMAQDPEPAYCRLFAGTPPVGVVIKGCDSHQDLLKETS